MLNFGKKPFKTISECTKLVENFLKKYGFNPKEQQNFSEEHGGVWHFIRGSAIVFIIVSENNIGSQINVYSPILLLPENNILPLYRRCLELNEKMINSSFCIFEDKICVRSSRYTQGLDPEELEEIIDRVSGYADLYDNKLSDEFGAKLFSEEIRKK